MPLQRRRITAQKWAIPLMWRTPSRDTPSLWCFKTDTKTCFSFRHSMSRSYGSHIWFESRWFVFFLFLRRPPNPSLLYSIARTVNLPLVVSLIHMSWSPPFARKHLSLVLRSSGRLRTWLWTSCAYEPTLIVFVVMGASSSTSTSQVQEESIFQEYVFFFLKSPHSICCTDGSWWQKLCSKHHGEGRCCGQKGSFLVLYHSSSPNSNVSGSLILKRLNEAFPSRTPLCTTPRRPTTCICASFQPELTALSVHQWRLIWCTKTNKQTKKR